METIRQSISKLAQKQHLTRQEARSSMDEIMSGTATSAQISAFLVGLRIKGETVEEIIGCAQSMREKATKVKTRHPVVIDTCGTGGDGTGSFNVSTVAAFVAAGAGAVVAKHGNRSVSSRCGSADVLKALGVRVEDVSVEKVEQCLDEIGIAFLYAPSLHTAMKFAAPVRKELGIRTIFNLLGPLTNPAGAQRQVVGVYDETLTSTVATALRELGSVHSLVVHGKGGFDEMSTWGLSTVSEVRGGEVRNYKIDPSNFGFNGSALSEVMGGDADTNARIVREVLEGGRGPARDIVLLNSSAALYVGGIASSIEEGISRAAESIDSGAAKMKLAALVELTNQ